MRVLHIIPTLNKGGAEKLVLDICDELSRKGVIVKLIVLSDKNTFELKGCKFSIDFIPSDYRYSIKQNKPPECPQFFSAIESFNPDVIHTHLFDTELISRVHVRDKTKYFTHAHWNTKEVKKKSKMNWISKSGLVDALVYRKMVRTYKACDNNFITISKHTDEYYKENLPEFKSQIYLLHNAVKVDAYKSDLVKIVDGTIPIKILTIGSLNSRKNQLFQIDIALQLKKRDVPFSLTVVGEGPSRGEIEQKIKKHQLEESVSLIGNSNEIPRLMQEHTMLLHTAVYEPFGLVLLEAMAAGLPVITYNGMGSSEILNDGKNGYLIESLDASLFATIIQDFFKDVELYKKMSVEAVDTAQNYDISQYVIKLIELYQRA